MNKKIFSAILFSIALTSYSMILIKRFVNKSERAVIKNFQPEQSAKKTLFLNGQIIIKNLQRVSTNTPGIVKEIFCTEGEKVDLGQRLAQFQSQQAIGVLACAQVELEIAQANLSFLEIKFSRTQELLNEGLISLEQYQSEEFEYKKANLTQKQAFAKAELAKNQLENLTIKAQEPGTVYSSKILPGDRVAEGSVMFELIPEAPLWQGVFIAQEFDLKHLQIGKSVSLNIYSLDLIVQTKIKFISPVGKQKGTFCCFEVIVEIPESVDRERLFSGLSAQIEVCENV